MAKNNNSLLNFTILVIIIMIGLQIYMIMNPLVVHQSITVREPEIVYVNVTQPLDLVGCAELIRETNKQMSIMQIITGE